LTGPGLHEVEPRRRVVAGAAIAAAVGGILVFAAWLLPRSADLPQLARAAMTKSLPEWHSTEPVNAIVYGFRAFDTFGETFILLAAVVGIGLITRQREPRSGFIGEEVAAAREQRQVHPDESEISLTEREALEAEAAEVGEAPSTWPRLPDTEGLRGRQIERSEAMTVVIRTGIRVVAPLIGVAAFYLFAWGFTPGGGFPAGVVALGLALLMYVSVGYRRMQRALDQDTMEPVELIGALLIAALMVGLVVARGNFLPLGPPETIRAGGTLQAFSALEFVEVATGLCLATFALLRMAHDWAPA
jgi:multicomponent Na+:H+ antiporter subunit B